jgi:small nuclear ribonucleoprotein (snRNP)-like protein
MQQAYDSHCNLVLGEVEETIYTVDEDDEDDEVKVSYCPGYEMERGILTRR